MLFKTNTNGHQHHSISLFIIEQDTLGETKENNKWHSAQEPRIPLKHIPISCDGCSFTNTDRHYLCVYIYAL